MTGLPGLLQLCCLDTARRSSESVIFRHENSVLDIWPARCEMSLSHSTERAILVYLRPSSCWIRCSCSRCTRRSVPRQRCPNIDRINLPIDLRISIPHGNTVKHDPLHKAPVQLSFRTRGSGCSPTYRSMSRPVKMFFVQQIPQETKQAHCEVKPTDFSLVTP